MSDKNAANRRVLVVGVSSKIAEHFILAAPADYDLYGTYNNTPSKLLSPEHQFSLDLTDDQQIHSFLKAISPVQFDAVLFFAASYVADPENTDDYLSAYQRNLRLNVASIMAVAKGIKFAKHSKLFLFGDAGLGHPKKAHTIYSVSKFAVADVARLLAVELAPDTSTFCLRPGPTIKQDGAGKNGAYYDRALIRVDQPVTGLVNLLHFLITENNFNATGCTIDYDGGAYIKRLDD